MCAKFMITWWMWSGLGPIPTGAASDCATDAWILCGMGYLDHGNEVGSHPNRWLLYDPDKLAA
jgi:hypothetical protein